MSNIKFFLFTSLIAIPSVFSQEEQPPVIPEIVKPAEPVEEAQPPAADNLGDTLIVEDIEHSPMSGEELADLYSEYTGRRVIVHSAASTAEFTFKQSASP